MPSAELEAIDGTIGIALLPIKPFAVIIVVEGISYKIITDTCFISADTVNGHIKNIYKKLSRFFHSQQHLFFPALCDGKDVAFTGIGLLFYKPLLLN